MLTSHSHAQPSFPYLLTPIQQSQNEVTFLPNIFNVITALVWNAISPSLGSKSQCHFCPPLTCPRSSPKSEPISSCLDDPPSLPSQPSHGLWTVILKSIQWPHIIYWILSKLFMLAPKPPKKMDPKPQSFQATSFQLISLPLPSTLQIDWRSVFKRACHMAFGAQNMVSIQ